MVVTRFAVSAPIKVGTTLPPSIIHLFTNAKSMGAVFIIDFGLWRKGFAFTHCTTLINTGLLRANENWNKPSY